MSAQSRNPEPQVLWHLRLYVVGGTVRAQSAQANLEALCSSVLKQGDYQIEVIDLLENPDSAKADNIILTPATVRLSPHPKIQVIGDLSDYAKARSILGMPNPTPHP